MRIDSSNGCRMLPRVNRVGTIAQLAVHQAAPVPRLPGVLAPADEVGRAGPGGADLPGPGVWVLDPKGRRPDQAPQHRGMGKSEVSRLAAELDQILAEFKERPMGAGPYRCLRIDALERVREAAGW